MASSRIKNSITNILTEAFGQLLEIVLNFALRTVFLYFLGKEYAGINGVLSGVLAAMLILSLMRRLMEAEHKRRNKHAEHS